MLLRASAGFSVRTSEPSLPASPGSCQPLPGRGERDDFTLAYLPSNMKILLPGLPLIRGKLGSNPNGGRAKEERVGV